MVALVQIVACVLQPGRHRPGESTQSQCFATTLVGQRLVGSDTSGRAGECKDGGTDVKEAAAICSLSIHYLSQCTLPWKLEPPHQLASFLPEIRQWT